MTYGSTWDKEVIKNIHTCCLKRNTDQHVNKLTQHHYTVELTLLQLIIRTTTRRLVQGEMYRKPQSNLVRSVTQKRLHELHTHSPRVRNNTLILGTRLL